ncbi:MAG: hypothetical protein AB7I57_18285 [Pirellulales bacterium]
MAKTQRPNSGRRSLAKPTMPAAIPEAEAVRLCKKLLQLTDERRECYRMADAKGKAIDAMKAELAIYVDANKEGKARTVTLKKFVLKIVQETKNLYYKGELLKELGEVEFNRRIAELGTVDKLEIDVLP